VVGAAARREVVEFIKSRNLSERRGCLLTNLNRESRGKMAKAIVLTGNSEMRVLAVNCKVISENWRKFYNTERSYSSLGYSTPQEFKSRMKNNKKLAISVG